jgi:hypothetical protein
MKLFNLKEGNIIIEPEALLVPEFENIWNADKTKNKTKALGDFKFIFLMCDISDRNPYKNYPQDKKEPLVLQEIYGDLNYKITSLVSMGMLKYEELTTTSRRRLLQSIERKIDDMSAYLDNTPTNDETIDTILKIFDKLSKTVEQYDKVESAVEKEASKSESHRRGSRKKALFEDK